MIKFLGILQIIGNVWIKVAVVIVILLYISTVMFSEAPLTERILSFINIWNIFIAFIIILPGYFLSEIAKWLENRYKKEQIT